MDKEKTPRKKSKSKKLLLRGLLLAQGKVLLVYLLCFLLAAYLSFLGGCKPAHSFYIAIAALSAAAMVSAAAAAKKAQKNGMIVGLRVTAPVNLLVILLVLAFTQLQPDLRLAITAAILLLSAALGGACGVNLKNKTRIPHQKGHKK